MEWLFGALLGGFLGFNLLATPDRAADKAEKALRERYPNANVQVELDGKRGRDVLNGRFKKLRLEMTGLDLANLPISTPTLTPTPASSATTQSPVAPPKSKNKPKKVKEGRFEEAEILLRELRWGDLPVEEARITLREVRYDFGALRKQTQLKVLGVESGSVTFRLSERALLPLVRSKAKAAGISDLQLQLNQGSLLARGQRQTMGFGAPFELSGTPEISGSQIVLAQPQLRVAGIPVPAPVAAPLLKSVNPLYTFQASQWPIPLKLRAVRSVPGALEVDADLAVALGS